MMHSVQRAHKHSGEEERRKMCACQIKCRMEGLLHYINPAHAISLLSALNEERLKGQLCDVLLIVGDQKFRAHKNVLAASKQGNHERLCRNATVCPYCSLRFFSPALKQEHEDRCEYKKLTCLECMRTFKSSFSIWRHQVEVHNQNNMALAENFALATLDHNGEVAAASRPQTEPSKVNHVATPKEDTAFSDSSEQVNFDSEDSSCLPEDLSLSKQLKVQVKEEPVEEAEEEAPEASAAPREAGPSKETGLWPCEKCGKMFTAHKQLEPDSPTGLPENPTPATEKLFAPQESDTLFYHAPPLSAITFKRQFMCKLCHRTFKTAFSLWSHEQTHN